MLIGSAPYFDHTKPTYSAFTLKAVQKHCELECGLFQFWSEIPLIHRSATRSVAQMFRTLFPGFVHYMARKHI
jgi:hypothetical protein